MKERSSRYDAYADIRRADREERLRRSGKIRLSASGAAVQPYQRIHRGNVRKSLVNQIIDQLEEWRFTPFEFEGPMQHGLRAALCLGGNSWSASDHEARALVGEALRIMGAERPSWAEGQWSYVDSPDRCSWCQGPIQDDDRTPGQRFCSVLCAKSALEHRVFESRATADAIGQSAQVLIARKGRPSVQCVICGKSFQPRNRDARHCSPACRRAARGDLLQDRSCLWCGATFHPRDASMRCCSQSCGVKHAIRVRAETLEEKSCPVCRSIFRPKLARSIYCSPRCGRIAVNRAYRARQREK